jgi:hypothetical protein
MRPSPYTVGLLMIFMAGIGVSGMGTPNKATPVAYAIAGVLAVAGATMFLKKPFAFYIAMAAAALLAVSGLLALLGKPELALPVPPALSLVIGLYLCLRTVIARPSLQPKKEPRTE